MNLFVFVAVWTTAWHRQPCLHAPRHRVRVSGKRGGIWRTCQRQRTRVLPALHATLIL